MDSNGICWFVDWGVPGSLEFEAKAVSAATGFNITRDEALVIGERVVNLERVLHIKMGLRPEDDIYDVGLRFLGTPPKGPGKDKDVRKHVKLMVKEYYRLMGWNEKIGKPLRYTLERLGLHFAIKDLYG